MLKTDHYSLKFLLDQPLATIPQHHWVGKLLGFNFTVEYKAGSSINVADALSQCDMEETTILAIFSPWFYYFNRFRQANIGDQGLMALRGEIEAGTRDMPRSIIDVMVAFQTRFYLPPASPLLQEIIAAVQDDRHLGVRHRLHCLRHDFHSPNLHAADQDFFCACNTCQ